MFGTFVWQYEAITNSNNTTKPIHNQYRTDKHPLKPLIIGHQRCPIISSIYIYNIYIYIYMGRSHLSWNGHLYQGGGRNYYNIRTYVVPYMVPNMAPYMVPIYGTIYGSIYGTIYGIPYMVYQIGPMGPMGPSAF
jgi:hypothetical protein